MKETEKHKCRLCFKLFSNGSALGGHMRSHFINLQKLEEEEEMQSISTWSSPSSTSSLSHSVRVKKSIQFPLRQNPNQNTGLLDTNLLDTKSGHDRESEMELSSRRRSKRARKKRIETMVKNKNLITLSETESSWAREDESTSSISDARTTDEYVAFILMMLSRDKWKKVKIKIDDGDDRKIDQEEEEEEEEDWDELKWRDKKTSSRGKYKCGTCEKVFKSYQALGGHRASHKKEKLHRLRGGMINNSTSRSLHTQVNKRHQCPYCLRVFSSGQALGGHKRSHFIGEASTRAPRSWSKYLGIIDLNLPALGEENTHTS
ncbi:Zinc finger protein ZAT9 [Linum perenne]